MDTATLSFVHRFEPGNQAGAALLLLHGTGGNENDLLPLGRAVAPARALLSLRGKVSEGGMARFFRRLAEGLFDEEDVRRRAHELARFVTEARQTYGLADVVALGFSNGANIAAALLLLTPEALNGAVLIRAIAPFKDAKAPRGLAGKPVLMLSGSHDPMAAPERVEALVATLRKGGATVQHEIVPAGHGLTDTDVTLARKWLEAL
jgi:phospholipase/carboxylesterase